MPVMLASFRRGCAFRGIESPHDWLSFHHDERDALRGGIADVREVSGRIWMLPPVALSSAASRLTTVVDVVACVALICPLGASRPLMEQRLTGVASRLCPRGGCARSAGGGRRLDHRACAEYPAGAGPARRTACRGSCDPVDGGARKAWYLIDWGVLVVAGRCVLVIGGVLGVEVGLDGAVTVNDVLDHFDPKPRWRPSPPTV